MLNNGSAPGGIWNQPGGLWNIQCDQQVDGGGGMQFVNQGLVLKSAGSGTTLIEVPFVNSGTGSATFRNLVYHLANPVAAESPVIAFTSPGLPTLTNAPALVWPVFSSITLQDHNSVVQICPTNELGLYSWTVTSLPLPALDRPHKRASHGWAAISGNLASGRPVPILPAKG